MQVEYCIRVARLEEEALRGHDWGVAPHRPRGHGLARAHRPGELAGGLVDSLIDVSKGAGGRIGQKDPVLDSLSTQALDRFWEELARVLDQGPVLERSQELVALLLEDLKRSSFRQLRDQGGVDALISELDGLNFNRAASPTRPQA